MLCSLLDCINLKLFLYDWDVEFPNELDGKLLIKKCSHDIRKKIDYFNKHPKELKLFPQNQLIRMNDDICDISYEEIDGIKEELHNLVG